MKDATKLDVQGCACFFVRGDSDDKKDESIDMMMISPIIFIYMMLMLNADDDDDDDDDDDVDVGSGLKMDIIATVSG